MIAFFALGVSRIVEASGENPPTFSQNVAPLLIKNCVNCHASGQIASRVPLTTYDEVQSQAQTIKLKVMAREMPPSPADPENSVKLRNDNRLSQQEIDTIVAWVNAGLPVGEDAELPQMRRPEGEWLLAQGRKPDLVIAALPGHVSLPATGESEVAEGDFCGN